MSMSPAWFNSSSESFSDQESMVKTRSFSFQQIDLLYGTPLSGLLIICDIINKLQQRRRTFVLRLRANVAGFLQRLRQPSRRE